METFNRYVCIDWYFSEEGFDLSVAMAVLTCNRPDDINRLLDASKQLKPELASIHLVDAGQSGKPDYDGLDLTYHKSEINLGGAGGFSFAILSALASGADWIWIMDDDACPIGVDCLRVLLNGAEKHNLDVISPLIVSPQDNLKTAFPFKIGGRLTIDRKAVQKNEFIPNLAHFFNGALVRRDVFFKVGIPDIRLFIRGDEVDFLLRLRRSGVRFGTLTTALVSHPPVWGEIASIIEDRVQLLVPETSFKKYYFFRNRGYLARRHRRPLSFFADIILYPYYFLIKKKLDWRGFNEWWRAFYDGLCYRFGRKP
ncbi:glycosyltransferase [Brucella grignonensis]|uniref:Glycosyl transferase 2 family protein n=1 Tax=Brucella grignonensis TaxID=94627 RepID=A0A256F605_9HYPH|nr:glycosyltransferase [Brucella grignonensis]OYR10274.1 glycosyl transferase 2 family protein [Brucella grignonensis]